MLDTNGAFGKANIFGGNTKCFANAASQVKQENADSQTVPEIGGVLLEASRMSSASKYAFISNSRTIAVGNLRTWFFFMIFLTACYWRILFSGRTFEQRMSMARDSRISASGELT